jgi:hypothetical protein
MTVYELRREEIEERKDNKNASNCSKYLKGQLKPSDDFIIQKLKGEIK